jgi:hypothetical protein
MRRVSLKRQHRNREAAPVRDALRSLGRCEWCSTDRHKLDVHEVANGASRGAALDQLYALLLLCRRCHDDLHRLPKDAAVCIGLALIRNSRPEHYSLDSFYKITARRWPDESTVEIWWRRILNPRS